METRPRYDEKLEMILREAAGVFAEKGFDGASVRDIAAATGVSLSGLYYYFKSKEELLFLIQTHCFDTVLDRLREDLAETPDPEERLRVIVRNHLRFFAANMREMKVLSHEAEALGGDFAEGVTDRKREYATIVREALAELAPPSGGVDLRVATYSLFGMINWIYNWYRLEGEVPVDQLADEMVHLFLDGYRIPLRSAQQSAPSRGTAQPSIWRSPASG